MTVTPEPLCLDRLDEYGAVPLRHRIRAIDAALRARAGQTNTDPKEPRP